MSEVQEDVQKDNLEKKIALQFNIYTAKVASHVLDVSRKAIGLLKFCKKSIIFYVRDFSWLSLLQWQIEVCLYKRLISHRLHTVKMR